MERMKIGLILGALLVIAILMSFFGGGVEGKYVSQDNPGDYLNIYKEGRFFCRETTFIGPIEADGGWRQEGDKVSFYSEYGSETCRIEKDIIICGGTTWKKK